MTTKFRQYCIVVHNVDATHKDDLIKSITGFKNLCVAAEPYPDQAGHHFHIQIEFHNQRSKHAVINYITNITRSFILPIPEPPPEGSWGRVQVDPMYGSWKQAVKYLTDPDKEKETDPDVVQLSNNRYMRCCTVCKKDFMINTPNHHMDFADRKTGVCTKCYIKDQLVRNLIDATTYCDILDKIYASLP